MNKSVLVIEREPDGRMAVKSLLEKAGLRVMLAQTGQEGLQQVRDHAPDIVLMNLYLNPPVLDDSGLEALRLLREEARASVIVYGVTINLESMRQAMRLGAFDYVPMPLSTETLFTAIERLLALQNLQAEVERLRREVDEQYSLHGLIGQTPQMRRVFRLIEQVAPSESHVLITGASGTGKELVAKAIHFNSSRRRGPFVALNCGTLPDTLAESELFGHERGAFTGAVSLQKGKLELAYTGTLFLDEIGEMPLTTQVNLLRVLDDQQFMRIGGTSPINLNARIIAASNRNLERAVQEGAFRQDLFYRLNVIRVHLPPLAERREDIPLLVDYFLRQMTDKTKRLAPGVMEHLMRQPWPGNIRELRNAVERAIMVSGGEQIRIPDFFPLGAEGEEAGAPGASEMNAFCQEALRHLDVQNARNLLERVEEAILRAALSQAGGNKTRAAALLGTHRKQIERRITKYGL
jgi:DNA-binding NtrC family response regulator